MNIIGKIIRVGQLREFDVTRQGVKVTEKTTDLMLQAGEHIFTMDAYDVVAEKAATLGKEDVVQVEASFTVHEYDRKDGRGKGYFQTVTANALQVIVEQPKSF